ncbi:gamma-glutamyltransferase family protein [Peribacillus glennii]|uniref:Uncharacterized protein n=1 Tax=Peribacillus glennii TaxID=2303991 RepID=A0A372LGU7_9BACI|nr:hypothetical protein [Peribacillus glennii]RFU65533.1 hypothetical protein D0466_06535 [Peribacillus glennii]
MAYIIEYAKLYQHGKLVDTSIAVKDNRIYSIHLPVTRLRHMRMKAGQFIMAPANVMVAMNFQVYPDENYLKCTFIGKGASTIIVTVPVKYEYELTSKLKEYRSRLKQCPLDYLFAFSIPQNLVTPKVISFCKKEKIPAVFINMKDPSSFNNIAWSWIKQAAFPYNPVFIPSIDTGMDPGPLLHHWCQILSKHNIPHISATLNEEEPLTLNDLKKIGIYPQRGDLHSNGEVSYNLFLENALLNVENGIPSFDYGKLVVTVLKGKVIRAGAGIDLSELKGDELNITTPGFFVSD